MFEVMLVIQEITRRKGIIGLNGGDHASGFTRPDPLDYDRGFQVEVISMSRMIGKVLSASEAHLPARVNGRNYRLEVVGIYLGKLDRYHL